MKSATAAACLPTNHYFEKVIDLTRKPPHQLHCQFSYTKVSELKGVIEKETDTTQEAFPFADCTCSINMTAFQKVIGQITFDNQLNAKHINRISLKYDCSTVMHLDDTYFSASYFSKVAKNGSSGEKCEGAIS